MTSYSESETKVWEKDEPDSYRFETDSEGNVHKLSDKTTYTLKSSFNKNTKKSWLEIEYFENDEKIEKNKTDE